MLSDLVLIIRKAIRVHFNNRTILRAPYRTFYRSLKKWRPPLFPGDIQRLKRMFEDRASGDSTTKRQKYLYCICVLYTGCCKIGPAKSQCLETNSRRHVFLVCCQETVVYVGRSLFVKPLNVSCVVINHLVRVVGLITHDTVYR